MNYQTQATLCNTAQQAYPADVCVPELIAGIAAVMPDAPAVVAAGRTVTYRELDTRANQMGHYLRSLGVRQEALVGVCLDRSPDMVVSALAIWKAGGAYLPLDPAYPANRLAFMLDDSRAPVLISRQSIAGGLPSGNWKLVAVDGDAAPVARAPQSAPAVETAADNLAYVIYTSGSTGQPKGVMLTHGGLLNLVFWHRQAFGVTAADRATQISGAGFDAAVWEIWPYLSVGASLHIPDELTRTEADRLRDWLLAEGITISFVPTPVAERMIGLEWPRKTALRDLLTGGDRLHQYPPARLPFTLINNYGPTETTVVATSGPVSASERPDVLPTIGRPIANTQVYILDDNLRQVPSGAAGEIYIGGAGLARGYLNRPDLDAERFVPNPFGKSGERLYRTGDIARYLPDGQIAFLGRSDDQVKIRGYRIEPGEIAAALNEYPGVQSSLVVAREDTPGDKRLVAYIVPQPDKPDPAPEALQEFLKGQLPGHMIPAAFVRLDAFPLTANGKIDRAALPTPDRTNALRSEKFIAPRTPVEERLSGILRTLLKRDRIGVEDNFFLLGGHSLLGAQVVARVRDTFSVDLPLRTLFDNPTVSAMSVEIERLISEKLRVA